MNLRKFREQAQSNNTKPDKLAELSKNKDKLVRKYVASNPNTPIEILEILGAEFSEIVVKNPIFDLLLLENPSSHFVKLSLARSSNTQKDILNKIANLDSFTVRDLEIIYAISKHQNTPLVILEKLLAWYPFSGFYDFNTFYGADYSCFTIKNNIKYFVAKNKNIPESLLTKIAYNCSQNIDSSIPSNRLNPKTKKRLKDSINFKILRAIANHQNTPTKTLEYLAAEDDCSIHQIILKHPKASYKAIDIIKFRQGILKKKLYFIEELARDNRKQVRAFVANYKDAPYSIVQLLTKDKELLVLLAILQRSNLPAVILEELAKQSSRKIHKAILKHPNVSYRAKDIILLMRSRVPVRIDNSILEELANDKRVKVRKKVVQNELTPSYILRKLARDSEKYIRDKAVKNLELKNSLIADA